MAASDEIDDVDILEDCQNLSTSKEKGRGIVKMHKIRKARKSGEKIKVGWNNKGQPINPNKASFVYYLGLQARLHVPISATDWRVVKSKVKDKVWERMRSAFVLEDHQKKRVLSLAACYARNFRAYLRKHHVYGDDGRVIRDPPECYSKFKSVRKFWAEFIRECNEEHFKGESKTNSDRAKLIEHRHKIAAKGYAVLEQEKIKESGGKRKSIPRHELWVDARRNKYRIIEDREVQKINEDCEILQQSLTQEESEVVGPNDIFARVIGRPEHAGRVRAQGFGATKYTAFGEHIQVPVSEWKAMKDQIQYLTQLMTQHGVGRGSTSMPERTIRVPDEQIRSSNPKGDINIPEGDSKCFLYMSTPEYRLVGEGIVYNRAINVLHGKPLSKEYLTVTLSKVVPGEDNTVLPVPEPEGLYCLSDAKGAFVAWPVELISLHSEVVVPSTQWEKEKTPSKQSVFSPLNKLPILSVGLKDLNLDEGNSSFLILKSIANDSTSSLKEMHIPMNAIHWGLEFVDIIGKENILEIVNHKWLSASSVRLYIRFLCDAYLSDTNDLDEMGQRTNRFFFTPPYHGLDLDENAPRYSSDHEASKHLAEYALLGHKGKDHLVMVPIVLGVHWVLLAFNTREMILYYLNPNGKPINTYPRLRKMINNAVQIFRALSKEKLTKTQSKKPIKTITVKCPLQDNEIDCGYLVGLFIKDILIQGKTHIPINYFKECQASKSGVLNFRKEWCTYLYHFFVKTVLAKQDIL